MYATPTSYFARTVLQGAKTAKRVFDKNNYLRCCHRGGDSDRTAAYGYAAESGNNHGACGRRLRGMLQRTLRGHNLRIRRTADKRHAERVCHACGAFTKYFYDIRTVLGQTLCVGGIHLLHSFDRDEIRLRSRNSAEPENHTQKQNLLRRGRPSAA